ncbi:MAG: hypothetical protein AAF632_16420 [Bacteroidota bacterium]
MRIGCIILARYNSSRLPGKALMQLNNKPLLQYVHDSLATVFPEDKLLVATSSLVSDDPIAEYCHQQGINCFRGDLDNVAGRFLQAAQEYSLDYAMRINGDNLFVELSTVKNMITDSSLNLDFYSNVPQRTFPYGMSAEMVNAYFFETILPQISRSAKYREHVTLYLYDHPEVGKRKYYINQDYPKAKGIHLSIDTPDDAELAQKMLSSLPQPIYQHNLQTIVETYHQVKQNA